MNTIAKTYVSSLGINKHTFSITITKEEEVQFPIWFMQMFHRKFVDARQVLLV
jgi:hypothetical protein